MAYITQISELINDAFNDAIAASNTATAVDTTNIVSMGSLIRDHELYEPFFKSLTNRIVKTVYAVRSYTGVDRKILRDEHEYGAFVQKVYYNAPDATDNPTYDFSGTDDAFVQQSPYDITATVAVSALIYGGKGTWTLEVVRPIPQINTAFLSEEAASAFVDGMYIEIQNKFKLQEERLVATAANTSMAMSIAYGLARNLLAEYNTAHSTSLTPKQALESSDFLKYASMEISRTIDNMGMLSTAFNGAAYKTFTPIDKLVVEMNTQFAKASDMYLQADTFHNELVSLPNYTKIPFWQASGKTFDFADTSKISVIHERFEGDDHPDGKIEQAGIICFLHDIDNVAAYFGRRRTWELYNPRSEVINHGEKAEKGFAVDFHMNSYVFYIA